MSPVSPIPTPDKETIPESRSKPVVLTLLQLPTELQVNFLTYLRAYDLASVQQTCKFYHNPVLVHAIVLHAAERVYPKSWTAGFEKEPVVSSSITTKTKAAPSKACPCECYTFEHLRNMELLVVARVLSQPEPASGYIVSKSWCKTALRWLESQQERTREQQQQKLKLQQQQKKDNKVSKKKQRLRQRRLSDACPPWPNVNSDLLCEHNSLQTCSNSKTLRARRRLMDKQAWKTLKRLFPDSTQLSSHEGECLQCRAEAEIVKRTELDQAEQCKLQRKQPLSDPIIRRFYTRTKGVPEHALKETATDLNVAANADESDSKLPADQDYSSCSSKQLCYCPLKPGRYYILPRSWCHGWRRYIKTGEGGVVVTTKMTGTSTTTTSTSYPGPDAASLLCHAHRLVLLPPHLEAYLYGECDQLMGSSPPMPTEQEQQAAVPVAAAAAAPPVAAVGAFDPEHMQALQAAGMAPAEVRRQMLAMRNVEQQIQQQLQVGQPHSNDILAGPFSKNERLDRENHSVVEILTEQEFSALETLWPTTIVFGVPFDVKSTNPYNLSSTPVMDVVSVVMPVCHECDNTGWAHRVKCVRRGRTMKNIFKANGDPNIHNSSSSSSNNNKAVNRAPPVEY